MKSPHHFNLENISKLKKWVGSNQALYLKAMQDPDTYYYFSRNKAILSIILCNIITIELCLTGTGNVFTKLLNLIG